MIFNSCDSACIPPINELRRLIPIIQEDDDFTPNERYDALEELYMIIVGYSIDALAERKKRRKEFGLE